MLVGYVSDERYVALTDVVLEFDRDGATVAVARSTPRGAVHAEVEPGPYRVTLVKPGFGSKRVQMQVLPGRPYAFRLLSNRLLGYAWPRWVRTGERSEFRVHSPEPYRLSLWRYGLRKEFVKLIGWYDEHGPSAVAQITPDGDYTRTGVSWNRVGYRSLHPTQFVTGPERSGLYYFHAEGESSGAFFSFPWVVAPLKPQAPIAVVASTNTWNAYNNFGGRSNYIHAAGLPPEPTVNARQELVRYQGGAYTEWNAPNDAYAPLSFDRPEPFNHVPKETEVTDPIAGRQPCHLAPAEWRLLAWLEREGFSYDLHAEYQLHAGQVDLDTYRILILSVHPEYWSREMYHRVKSWVFERGGRLMYLGGNGLTCEVELPDEATMRCRSQIAAEGGGAGCESRMHRTLESEAGLLGVVFTEPGAMTGAPYRVTSPGHWVFSGTGLTGGATFGEACLHERCPGGASGHETDKRSPHTPAQAVLLARGLNPEDGGAEMVFFETAAGGAVFSAGSISYPASLLVDESVSRITANVIHRFLS